MSKVKSSSKDSNVESTLGTSITPFVLIVLKLIKCEFNQFLATNTKKLKPSKTTCFLRLKFDLPLVLFVVQGLEVWLTMLKTKKNLSMKISLDSLSAQVNKFLKRETKTQL